MGEQSKIIWDPYTPGYFENPYEHLQACREQNQIHKVFNSSWIFLRYKEVSEILSSNKFGVSEFHEFFKEKEPYIFKNSTACPYLSKGTKMWPMYLNNEVHKHTRAIMGKSLTIKDLDKALIEFVDSINKHYQHKNEFDLVTYCSEYIFLVLKRILGINDFEEFEKVKKYSNMLALSQDLYIPKQVYLQINEWLLWGKELFTDSEYQKNIGFHSDQAGLNYSEEDIYSMAALTLMAAFETSKDNLTVALHEILKNPKLVNYVLECSPQELNILIEELLRFSSPLQYTIRINNEPLEYDAINIPAHSKLYLCMASANRDSTVFKNPNEILVDRNPNEHLSFGKGVHFCIGANIARQELRYCLKPMVRFLKKYELKKGGNIKWAKQIFMRTVESVELEAKF